MMLVKTCLNEGKILDTIVHTQLMHLVMHMMYIMQGVYVPPIACHQYQLGCSRRE